MKLRIKNTLKFLLFLMALNAGRAYSNERTTSWTDCKRSGEGKITIYYYNSDNFISDASGTLQGLEYELLNEFVTFLNRHYGYEISINYIKANSFTDLYAIVKDGSTGVFGACSFSITEKRKQEVNFSPKYMPDIEVLICSNNLPAVTDTAEFIKAFSKARALTVPNTTFDQNLQMILEVIPELQIEKVAYASIIRDRIASGNNLFSYIELPTYFASIKEGIQLKRQPVFKVERSGYGIIFPLNSDWNEPLEAFFAAPSFKPFMNSLIHKYFGEDVQDLIWNVAQDNSLKGKEIALLTKERDIQDLVLTKKKLEIQAKNLLVIAFVIGFVLVVILVFVIWKGYNSKKKANEILLMQKAEIEKKNLEIEKINEALNVAMDGISLKNKEITDSINYSKRIQQAILPSDETIGKNFSESFILFMPKDIVSGDFYWYYEPDQNRKEFLIATADCTGHGVPGAFMSLIGSSLLNEIVIEKKIIRPDLVLNNLREGIINSLNPKGGSTEAKDGIDIVFCKYDMDKMAVQYSSAFNKFYLIRNGELIEFLADKFPVGKYAEDEKPFTLNEIEIKKGDLIYTFSDGYADQFGGPNGKKFKYKQLQRLLLDNWKKSMAQQKEILFQTLDSWKADHEQVDDICIIGLKV